VALRQNGCFLATKRVQALRQNGCFLATKRVQALRQNGCFLAAKRVLLKILAPSEAVSMAISGVAAVGGERVRA
jgi:hypothetical protein